MASKRSLPAPRIDGHVAHVAEIARDVVEVIIEPAGSLLPLPGQYCRFQFEGYPARLFSPTASLNRIADDGKLRLHIKRVRDGLVTPRLGGMIKAGHGVQIEGPFGPAASWLGRGERLILVGSGTGFAPVWMIAAAALRNRPYRQMILIAAARTLDEFYMAPALMLASRFPNVSFVAAVQELAAPWHGFVPGHPLEHSPPLEPRDIVYAAGPASLIRAAGTAASAAGAAFRTAAFVPVAPQRAGWIDTAREWLKAG